MNRTTSLPTRSTTSQRDERPGALGHLHRPAGLGEIDEVADEDIEIRPAPAQRGHRGLHALDVTLVVGAPDVDQDGETPSELVPVIGHVGSKIGPAAVRFANRPVRVVAERGRTEQGLRPGFPILVRPALGLFEDAFVEQVPILEVGERFLDRAGGGKRALR